jgi:predicted O-methyltransferase YrrM
MGLSRTDPRTLAVPVKATAKRRANAAYLRWAPEWARRVSGHTVVRDVDLDVLRHLRAVPHAHLRDSSFLERELLPLLGLSDENYNVFPSWLWPALGRGLRCWQYPIQFGPYLAQLSRYPIRSYLEIGVQHGGSFITTVQYLERFRPVDVAIGVDLLTAPGLIRYAVQRDSVEFLRTDSASRRFRQSVASRGPFDLVLIDGDHSREACERDLATVLGYANMIALHDIVDTPSPGVGEVWRHAKSALAGEFDFFEYTRQYDEVRTRTKQEFLGIGLAVRKRWL